jgi:transposase InsO family protein
LPWKEVGVVNERMRFVLRVEDGERMTDLCREFGISRKTGYKLWGRYRELGGVGLFDEPRRPERIPHRTPPEIQKLLVETRDAHPTWGPRKVRAWCMRHHEAVRWPAPSTVGEILRRHGRVAPRRRKRRAPPYDGPLTIGNVPNQVWAADYKGQIRLGSGAYCYPLTITDLFSRYIIACEGLDGTGGDGARAVFAMAFREIGLPEVIRTDNGTPFASRGLAGLSRLAVWWRRLGIRHERIEPAHPEQNGTHERMHLTLKQETTRPPAANLLAQQERFDRFVDVFNRERPHEALGQTPPTDIFRPSERRFVEPAPEPTYPLHDEMRLVTSCGHVILHKKCSVFVSEVLGGERVGLRELEPDRWLLTFVDLDLGHLDAKKRRFVALEAEPHAAG